MAILGFLGGTGDLGQGLAVQLAKAYDKVVIGSREKQKAEGVVSKLSAEKPHLKGRLEPATNEEVAERCDIVLATLPAKHAVQGVRELAGHFRGNQLLITTAAPTPKLGADYLPAFGGEGTSGGNGSSSSVNNPIVKQMKQELAQKSIEIAAAFQTVPADALARGEKVEADVPVACNDKETFEKVAKVVGGVKGLRPVYFGTLEVGGMVEGLTSVLLNVGTHNHIKSPAIKFVQCG